MKLQRFGVEDSQYERPNQKWVCGWTDKGCPCAEGPDNHGRCRAVAECTPVRRGDRWICQRHSSRGGACLNGPLPDGSCCQTVSRCQPVRSIRAKRGMVTVWGLIFVTGILFSITGSKFKSRFILPGQLNTNHGNLRNDCRNCHRYTDLPDLRSVLKRFVSNEQHRDQFTDSLKCAECHEIGVNSLAIHNLSEHELNSLREKRTSETSHSDRSGIDHFLISMINRKYTGLDSRLDCATCHREHQGNQVDISMMSNKRCQSCHIDKFSEFAGHPEFSDYPSNSNPSITFDHNSHFDKHFLKSDRTSQIWDCSSCHVGDEKGQTMQLRPFEDSCATCHEQQIRGEGRDRKSIAFFSLPELDTQTLSDKNIDIGEWPDDSDGKITLYMKILLSSRYSADFSYDWLSDLELYDLTDLSEKQLRDIQNAIVDIKMLFAEMKDYGHDAIIERLTRLTGRELSQNEKSGVSAGLPADTITQAAKTWFPNIETEIESIRTGKPLTISDDQTQEVQQIVEQPSSHTSRELNSDDEILSDDDILDEGALNDSDNILDGDDEILSGDDEILDGDDEILGDDNILGDDDDILSDDILGNGDILTADDEILGGDDEILGDDILGKGDILAADDEILDEDSSNLEIGESEMSRQISTKASPKSINEWGSHGGWYLKNSEINYRPTGHGDGFLKFWLTTTMKLKNEGRSTTAIDELFNRLSGADAIGACMKCHIVDSDRRNKLFINWHPEKRKSRIDSLTKFYHETHLKQAKTRDCNTCHQQHNDEMQAADFARTRGPHSNHSDFMWVQKS